MMYLEGGTKGYVMVGWEEDCSFGMEEEEEEEKKTSRLRCRRDNLRRRRASSKEGRRKEEWDLGCPRPTQSKIRYATD